MIKLHGQWGPRLRRSVHRGWTKLLRHSSSLSGAEVEDARDGSWRGSSWCRLYLASKPSHVGSQCGWASLPSAPSYSLQLSVKRTELPVRRCLVPSCGSGWCTILGGAMPRARIFDGVLTIWVPLLSNLAWSNSFLPGYAYSMLEPSWHLCMYPWLSHYVRW
jgi:hypothetical protein